MKFAIGSHRRHKIAGGEKIACYSHLAFLSTVIFLLSLSVLPAATPESKLFQDGNTALAHGDPDAAIAAYTKIADSAGTSPALADNIAAASELAGEPGLTEWANRTALLRRTEWWLILAGFSASAWAAAIAFGTWKRWTSRKFAVTSLLGAAGVAGGLWCAHHWMPPADEAVVIKATPHDGGSIPAADVLLSPFDSAEVVGTVVPGARVRVVNPESASTPPPKGYVRIRHPDTDLAGWMRAAEVRRVGK